VLLRVSNYPDERLRRNRNMSILHDETDCLSDVAHGFATTSLPQIRHLCTNSHSLTVLHLSSESPVNGLGFVSGAGAKPKKRHAFAAVSHVFCAASSPSQNSARSRNFVWPGNALISPGKPFRCCGRVPAPTAEVPLSRGTIPRPPHNSGREWCLSKSVVGS